MRAAALRRALVTTPEPPCTKFACANVARCALGLACEAFSVYANHGRAPTRAIFAELFGDAERAA